MLQQGKVQATKSCQSCFAISSQLEALISTAEASEDDIARHAVKLNVFHTINFMLQQLGLRAAVARRAFACKHCVALCS